MKTKLGLTQSVCDSACSPENGLGYFLLGIQDRTRGAMPLACDAPPFTEDKYIKLSTISVLGCTNIEVEAAAC